MVDIYYPAYNVGVELQIAPTNTGVKEVPGELLSTPFNDPKVINRFNILLDTVFAHIPHVNLLALNIGNESDLNFGAQAKPYNEFKIFLDSVSTHAKKLYFNLHGADLKVGTTFTHHGLVDTATSDLCKLVNTGLDIVTLTYYPLDEDFTMKPPSVVSSDFDALVAQYPDTAQPIYFAECGYASSPLCNSSETLQADFWTEVFHAWDTHQDHIKYMTIFKSTDWSAEAVNELGEYYNLQDTVFKEYLRTLGLRTWNEHGTDKEAYRSILCELAERNWCNLSSCSVTNLEEYNLNKHVSVYPNPGKNVIHIDSDPMPNRPYTFQLYDSQARLVRTIESVSDSFLLERQDLKSGIYLYHLYVDDDIYKTGRLIFE